MAIFVATAPTVYGIETCDIFVLVEITITLQQHLPFTVLKLKEYFLTGFKGQVALQQHLPFTVLKPNRSERLIRRPDFVATAPTVYGIETVHR